MIASRFRLDVNAIYEHTYGIIMKKQLVATLFIITIPFLLVSCVSSLLKEKPPTFSKEVSFLAPADPFVDLKRSVYPSWKNRVTGNVISIFSDCQPGNPLSLTDLQRYMEESIDNATRLNEKTTPYQNKPALFRTIDGQVEGNQIQIRSLAFKRLNCGYLVSLSGKPEQLQQDKTSFDTFLKSLKFK